MGADIVHYFKIVEEGAGTAQYEERELTLLNTSNGVPRVRLEHLDIAAETDNETYGFAISYKNGGMYIGDKDGNKLYNEENGNVAYSFNMTSKKGNVISYSISPWITEQGEYTIVIPAGCFAVDGVDINKEFVRHFTIKDSEPTWSIPLYEGAESGTGTVGSQDHPMRGFSEIILTFPEDVQVKAGEPTPDNTPTLTTVSFSGSGSNRSELNTPVDGTTVSVGAEGHLAVIAFDPPLTTDGDYHLTIPAGCIQMLGALGDYVPVRAYSTYFTINDITTCEITPVTDSNVVKLDEIDIKFTEAKIVTPDPQADVKITLFDEEGNEVNGHTLAINMDGLTAKVSISPAITTAGKYRIAVPEGRFLCQSSANDDPEKTLAYDLWYTVVDPTLVNVSPAVDSELTKLDRVAVEFYNAVRIESKESAIKILNANGKEVTGYTVSVEVNPVDDQEYFINLTPAITASGKYTIVVPAGSFACKYSVDGEARENEEYTFAYVVKNPTSCTIAPADNSKELDEIETITFTFTNASVVTANAAAAIAVVDKDSNAIEDVTASISIEDNVATITFEPAITIAGDIKVTVPEGTFSCKRLAEEEAVAAKEYVLNYSIKDRSPMNFDVNEGGKEILVLEHITVEFPKAKYVEINDEVTEEITVTHVPTSTPAQVIARMGARAPEGAKTYSVTAKKLASKDNAIELTISPEIREAGETTVHIPEGKIIADGQSLPESHSVFAVKGDPTQTWVEMMYGDDAEVTVINTNGVVLMKNVPASEVRNLEPGMYIINGKTVLVR